MGVIFNEELIDRITCGYCESKFCGNHIVPSYHTCTKYVHPVTYTKKEGTKHEAFVHVVAYYSGVVVFMIGLLLLIGNLTGLFPTYPFAGFITTAIGMGIFDWGR